MVSGSYSTKYDVKTGLALRQDCITPGDKIILVDDVIGSGGTLLQASKLCKKLGADVVGAIVLLELDLGGRKALEEENVGLFSFINDMNFFDSNFD
tara:strand:- start:121 stop:408 length:288 start_codon:yes stop_codon:yes gene_type:complete